MSELTNNERTGALAASAGNTGLSPFAPGIDYTTLVHIDNIVDDSGIHVGIVADGGLTDDLQPTLNGRLPNGDGLEIRIYLNGSVIGYTTVGEDYNWTFTPSMPLEAGKTYDFQVFMLDPADGNTLWPSNTYTITTTEANQDNNSVPDAPAIINVVDNVPGGVMGALHNGDATNDASPVLSGQAEAGTTVNIYDNGVLLGSSTAAADGSWSFIPTAPLTDGEHNLTATAVNNLGESTPTDAFAIIVDTVISEPAIASISDDTGTYTGDVPNGGLTDDKQPLLSGIGEPGSTVTITMYGPKTHINHNIATIQVGEDGTWSYQFTGKQSLQSGDNVFHITSTDAAGNSAAGADYTVTLTGANQDNNAVPPDAPVIDSVVDNVKGYGGFTGNLKNGALTDDAHPTLSGHAEASTTVNIYDNGVLLGSTTTSASGSWAFTPPKALDDGAHILTATAANASGESDPAVFSIIVDTIISKPVLDTVTDNQGLEQGVVENGGLTDDSRPILNGHAEAGSRVDIHVFGPNGKQLYYQSVTANDDGSWTYQPKAFTTHGTYSFGISGIDQAGNAWTDYGDKYAINFVGENQDVPADTTPPDAPVITTVYDDAGSMQGNVVNGGLSDDNAPDISGTAEAGSIVTVSRVGPKSQNYVMGTAVADSNGHWTLKGADAQNTFNYKGFYHITATAQDAAGNTSAKSADYVVNYVAENKDDATPPDAPTITAGYDNVGDSQGSFGSGTTTDDTTPQLSGKAEAGSTVKIYDGSSVIGSVTANSSGNWAFTPSARSEGKHTFTATATDVAGNVSGKSHEFVVNIDIPDTTPPAAPVITTVYDDVGTVKGNVANGGLTDDGQVKISGTAEANSHVTVTAFADGKSYTLGNVVTDAGGHWSYQMSGTQNLRNILGTWTFTAKATDAAGNISNGSDPYSVNVVGSNQDDITPPNAPVITTVYDDAGTVKGNVANGGLTDDRTPDISGTSEAGSIVTVSRVGPKSQNYVMGTAVADSNGHWTLKGADAQNTFSYKGYYHITATAQDAAGNTSTKSADYAVNYVAENKDDITPPDSPIIQGGRGNESTIGDIFSGGKTDDSTPTLIGKAEAGSIVTIYDDSAPIASTIAIYNGAWSLELPERSNGLHTFTATATDAAGNVSGKSGSFVVNINSLPNVDFTETFNNAPHSGFHTADVYHLSNFDVTVVNQGVDPYHTFSSGFKTAFDLGGVGTKPSSQAMALTANTVLKLTMNHLLDNVSFKIGDVSGAEVLTVKYYDDNNQLLHTDTFDSSQRTTTARYEAPAGEHISSLQMSVNDVGYGLVWIDDVVGHKGDASSQQLMASTASPLAETETHDALLAHDMTLATLPEDHVQQGAVNLHDGTQNTLQLTLNDILSEAHDNLFVQDGHKQLAVTGDEGDVIELKVEDLAHNTWQDAGQVTAGGVQYEVYHHTGSDVELLVQQGVELHQVS